MEGQGKGENKQDKAEKQDSEVKPTGEQESGDKVNREDMKEEYKDLGEYPHLIEQVPVQKKPVCTFSYGERIRIAKLYSSHEEFLYKIIKVAGWVRTSRASGKEFMFIELTDGSTQKGLQIVIDKSIPGFDELQKVNVATSMSFKGTLIKSPAKGQLFELQLSQADKHEAIIFGKCDPGKYPLGGKKRHTNEFLREQAHLRPRTNLIGAVTRVRNNLAYATHIFFQEKGFLYIHTPIITASDCEGAGQMFQVTTVLPEAHLPVSRLPLIDKVEEEKKVEPKEEAKGKGKKEKKEKKPKQKKGEAKVGEEGKLVDGETQPESQTEGVKPQVLPEIKPVELIPFEERKINYKADLFQKPSFLTVSGQLNVENYCCALSDVYTFGPTFRAENSNTTRHLAEFWMIEPEIAFATLKDNMQCAEDYLKFCLRYVLANNEEELKFFEQYVEKGLLERLQKVIDTPFKHVSYTEGIEILEEHIKSKKVKFENKIFWGVDLASEHEKYLTEKVFEGPIILYNYPKDIKSFYMRQNEDGKTVQAMDVLVPRIGEIIGGSAREERLEYLDRRIEECKLDKESYWWYRALREYGSIPHAGFGLGFERLVMMATGVENIRDVIPFPRAPGTAEF